MVLCLEDQAPTGQVARKFFASLKFYPDRMGRLHGVFDWVAATAVNGVRQSPSHLFLLVYVAGVVMATFMSNDATAVVLTPAVFVAAKKANAEPLPLLFACALIANAASFVLPISNPANLVLHGGHMPPLGQWMESFALPSLASIIVTFVAVRLIERKRITRVVTDGLLIGADLGPNLSVTGSLATILWL